MKGRKLTNSFSQILNGRLNLQVGLRVLMSAWVVKLCYKTLADAAYFIKYSLQVCQPNALPCYPCAMGTTHTASCTSGSVNQQKSEVANLNAHYRPS